MNVDGGTTIAPSDALGEGETDLDVEESGAIAPGANERVYVSPNNTNANFIDGFEAAASDNIADTVSSSWGQPELDFFTDIAAPTSSQTFLLDAFHDAFLEMALQGQTVFIAAGDSGSFDTVRGCPAFGTPSAKNPVCNAPYAVDHPSSDPLVTAAGHDPAVLVHPERRRRAVRGAGTGLGLGLHLQRGCRPGPCVRPAGVGGVLHRRRRRRQLPISASLTTRTA